jgi:hypothetical protein
MRGSVSVTVCARSEDAAMPAPAAKAPFKMNRRWIESVLIIHLM